MSIFHIHDIITEARASTFPDLTYDHDEDELPSSHGMDRARSVVARITISTIFQVGERRVSLSSVFSDIHGPVIRIKDLSIEIEVIYQLGPPAAGALLHEIRDLRPILDTFMRLCANINARMICNLAQAKLPYDRQGDTQLYLSGIELSGLSWINEYITHSAASIGDHRVDYVVALRCQHCVLAVDDNLSGCLRRLNCNDSTIVNIGINLLRLSALSLNDCDIEPSQLLNALPLNACTTSQLRQFYYSFSPKDIADLVHWHRWLDFITIVPMLPTAKPVGAEPVGQLVFEVWLSARVIDDKALNHADWFKTMIRVLNLLRGNMHKGRAGTINLQRALEVYRVN